MLDTRRCCNPQGFDRTDHTGAVVPHGQASSMASQISSQRGSGYHFSKGLQSPAQSCRTIPKVNSPSPSRSPPRASKPGPNKWVSAEAKRNRQEHDSAMQELSLIEATNSATRSNVFEEQAAFAQLINEVAPLWTVIAFSALPLYLPAAVAISGCGQAAVVVACVAPLGSLAAAITPHSKEDISPSAVSYDAVSGWLQQRQNRIAAGVHATICVGAVLQLHRLAEVYAYPALVTTREWVLALTSDGVYGVAYGTSIEVSSSIVAHQADISAASTSLSTSIFLGLLILLCSGFQLIISLSWLLRDVPRRCGLKKVDQIAAQLRKWNFVIMRTTECYLEERFLSLTAKVWPQRRGMHRSAHLAKLWRVPSTRVPAAADATLTFASAQAPSKHVKTVLIPAEDTLLAGLSNQRSWTTANETRRCSCIAHQWILAQLHTAIRDVCLLIQTVRGAFGSLVRLSPMKVTIACINLVIAVQGPMLTQTTLIAWVSAMALLAASTEYVRSVADGTAYAEGMRLEQERRKRLYERHCAAANLRQVLQQPLPLIKLGDLRRAIDDASAASVHTRALQEARTTLTRVREIQHALNAVTKRKAALYQQRARDAATQLALAAAQPAMEMTLESLKSALNEARAAGVPSSCIADAEDALRRASHLQGLHTRATARLEAYAVVEHQAVEDSLPSNGARITAGLPHSVGPVPPAHPAQPTESNDSMEPVLLETQTLRSIDIQDVDEALQEARDAQVDAELCSRVAAVRQEALIAQQSLSANATMFYVRQRRKSQHARWRSVGGETRLRAATAMGIAALDRLHVEQETAALAEAMPRLELALEEAQVAKVVDASTADGRYVMLEMHAAATRLAAVNAEIDLATEMTELSSHEQLVEAETRLTHILASAFDALVHQHVIDDLERRLRHVRTAVRESAAAVERLTKAELFCNSQVLQFRAGQRTQLKALAVPELERSIDCARGLLLPEGILESAKEALVVARATTANADAAAVWLMTASRAGMKAMAHAAEDKQEAASILQAAVGNLTSALHAAITSNAENHVLEAKELLIRIKAAYKRATAEA